MSRLPRLRRAPAVPAVCCVLLVLAVCASAGPQRQGPAVALVDAVCDRQSPGPATPPDGAVVVRPGNPGALAAQAQRHPPGTTFWLAPGTHRLLPGPRSAVTVQGGDTFLGGPDAVLDGGGTSRSAFTGQARNVTIAHLTIQGFQAPHNEGVVNHDSGNGWTIADDTIQYNSGAAMMVGSHQKILRNCLRGNGQYGINGYQAGNGIADITVAGNEIVGNNTDHWERRIPGCGCAAGAKFWAVDGAVIRGNWIHDNHGPGLWADMDNNDFLIEGNLITGNDGEAIIYEISYNAIIRNNVIRGNTVVAGRKAAAEGDNFPYAAVYVTNSGGEPRLPARTDRIEIYGNVLARNWSGVTVWENADRFCGSPASGGDYCTLLVASPSRCAPPAISEPPLRHDCRWQAKRIDIHGNRFVSDPDPARGSRGYRDRMALLSNQGTGPEWSPYLGSVVEEAVTFHRDNRWHDNTYVGPWTFVAHDVGRTLTPAEWRSAPYHQDSGSTFLSRERR